MKIPTKIFLSAACLCVLFAAPAAFAQQYLGTNPVIAGVAVQCGGVPSVIQMIPDIAMARPGVILLNPALFQLPAKLQLFIYAHECAHQILGASEDAADCWAIRTGRDQAWFTEQDIAYLQMYFGRNAGDWTHAPGPVRVARMVMCYAS